ncbi:MAG: phage baseplate assembly protein V [bacterium]|nr:phage baseplate assembly protein V [bacterium]
MVTVSDVKRLLNPVKNSIFLLLGRAVVKLIENSSKVQKIQVVGLTKETITGIERLQNYGFESFPRTGSEAFIAFVNGNREQGVALVVQDPDARPEIQEGEVCVYTHAGNKVYLKTDSIGIESGKSKIEVKEQSVIINTETEISLKIGGSEIKVSSENITISGSEINMESGSAGIKIDSSGIVLKSGDGSSWAPNTNTVCSYSGLPHSTILKIKGE